MNTTTLQKALYTIKKLKQRLQEQSEKIVQPIAIVGLSCRFPQASNKNAYWELLSQGKNAIVSMPEERWKLLTGSVEAKLKNSNDKPHGGFLSNIDAFDAYFFGITPREALRMDPQQRLLLEVSYEAFEDARLNKETLAGKNIGIFASLYASQFFMLQDLESDLDALFIPTGNATSIAANRLSYLFDLRGPSMVIDTACSASLVALHIACLNLQNKLCDSALVCAAHINLLPSIYHLLSKAKMLSPDAQCKTFDAGANGYVPGEGMGAIVLKPLKKALEDQDRIYAVIAGSAVNQDGKTNGLTAPNGMQQEVLLRSAYASANIDPKNVSYVECHGTGTFLGDPIEAEALGEVINKQRDSDHPCWIGSVKTNIGHLEPAAGVASVIKVALALQHKKIPPHLNFSTPNPHIAFDKYHFQIPKKLEEWPKYGDYRLAGVSGFGFGGANAHIVLRELTEQEEAVVGTKQTWEDIPVRQWQHKNYWPDLKKEITVEKIQTSDYPFQGQQLISPLKVFQFEFQFNTEILPEIRDTYNILHVGYYLEMLAFTTESLSQQTQFTIENLEFSAPIMVPDKDLIKVQLILEKQNQQKYGFQFYSRALNQKDWVLSTRGSIIFHTTEEFTGSSVASIRRRCITFIDKEKYYKKITDMKMPAGESIRWTKEAWVGDKEMFAELQAPNLPHSNESFRLKIHFGIGDAGIQSLFALLPEKFMNPYVANHIGKLTYFGVKNTPAYIVATLKTIEEEGKNFVGNWFLLDATDKIIIAAENVRMVQLSGSLQIEQLAKINTQFEFKLTATSPQERRQQLTHLLQEQAAALFSMPKEDIDVQYSLRDMGLDSLLAVAFSRVIEAVMEKSYPLRTLLQGVSIAQIVDEILENDSDKKIVKKPEIVVKEPSNIWIRYRQKQTHPQLKLFCFPYGGGGASIYRDWQQILSTDIEVCPIQLPGREERLEEKPFDNINLLIDALVNNLREEFNMPFCFFGHSFGSLIAFELTRRLHRDGLPMPIHLFVSAYPDPRIPTKSLDNLITQLNLVNLNLFALSDANQLDLLTDNQIKQLVILFKENGLLTYSDSLINKEIVKILLPIFVGDMHIVKSYRYYDETLLDVPLTVFIGKKDTWVLPEDHFGWIMQTQKRCEFVTFDAGHLFIQEAGFKEEVLGEIRKTFLNYREQLNGQL